MIDFSRPFDGYKRCERCRNLRKATKATRRVYSPDGDALGWMCRECADVWNRCIDMAIDKAAAEMVKEAGVK